MLQFRNGRKLDKVSSGYARLWWVLRLLVSVVLSACHGDELVRRVGMMSREREGGGCLQTAEDMEIPMRGLLQRRPIEHQQDS